MDGDLSEYLAIFGAVAAAYLVGKVLFSTLEGLRAYFLSKPLGLGVNLKKQGQWAVVTGATDGIGKAYAHELAKMGMDVCLISRNPEKLSDVAKEIESKSSVKTMCITADFSGGSELYTRLRKELAGLDIGVLVNNVGMAYQMPTPLCDMEEETVRQLINMNCNSVAEMTHAVLPGMVDRKRGVVLNVSSASACKPVGTPLLTLYAATKAFVDTFSQSLHHEYKHKGVTVQSVMPFFVATKLSKIRKSSFFAPDPTSYVKQAISTIGLQLRTYGCVSHALQGYVVSRLPDWLTISFTLKQMYATRARALKRQQKAQ